MHLDAYFPRTLLEKGARVADEVDLVSPLAETPQQREQLVLATPPPSGPGTDHFRVAAIPGHCSLEPFLECDGGGVLDQVSRLADIGE
jgi:hypothetical protein